MNVIKFLFFLFFIISRCFFEYTTVIAQSLLLEDVVAGYKTNASSFYSSRVYYEFYEEEKIDFHENETHNQAHIKNTSGVKSQKIVYDYWTDFNNILLRGGNANDIDVVGLFANQKTDLTSSDFETLYRKIPVLSYSAKDKIAYKWMGYPSSVPINNNTDTNNAGHASAEIGTGIASVDVKNFRYPPFLAPSFNEDEFNVDTIFLTDYFFAGSLKDKNLLGKINREGKDYIVIESRKLNPNIVDGTSSGIVFYNVYTGWIDVEQGFLPVRIQMAQAQSVNGKFVDGHTSSLQYSEHASHIFEIQDIKKIENAFYPMRASLRFAGYSIQDNPDQKIKEQDEKTRGDVSNFVSSFNFNNVQTWVIHRVQPNVVVKNDTLTLPFPKGTEVYDNRTQKMSLAGMTESEYEAYLKAEEKALRTKYNFDSGYVLPDPNAKRKIEDYFPRAPRGYRGAFFI
ncbi:MAG: hypothetical protein LBJ67_06235, partial [Planctomycetaceae bacterium]|nr:hypothetical protein [Planctomycetaceae bacterium]